MEHLQAFMFGVIFALAAVYTGLRFYRRYEQKRLENYIPPRQATWRD